MAGISDCTMSFNMCEALMAISTETTVRCAKAEEVRAGTPMGAAKVISVYRGMGIARIGSYHYA